MSGATNSAKAAGRGRRPHGPRPREADLIARWHAGAWRGWRLRATDGAHYTVHFQGRPGGPVGPDFRDAVLVSDAGERVTGDIELHLSPAGWRAHGHAADPRYNDVALHITLMAGPGAAEAGVLASGRRAPLVVLAAQQAPAAHALPSWPCAGFSSQSATVRQSLLHEAGWARFEERVAALAAPGRPSSTGAGSLPGWSEADAALYIALAEGLGYGRDRATLRACGERLARGEPPDALLTTIGRAGALERRRAIGLLTLLDRWRVGGPLAALSRALVEGDAHAGAAGAARALIAALTVAERGAVSPGRARILAFNAALPYIVAWARARGASPTATALVAQALAATDALAGLPSNQITREMTRQLGLPRLPSGALAQQGQHHIWAHHCREKRCSGCPCAGWGGEDRSLAQARLRGGACRP